jgi:hypothetical protein
LPTISLTGTSKSGRVYGTLNLLNRFKRSTTTDLRLYLVRALIMPIVLHTDVVFFLCLISTALNRLQLAFNSCVRYVFGLRRFDHISEFESAILGCPLFTRLLISASVRLPGYGISRFRVPRLRPLCVVTRHPFVASGFGIFN